MIALNRVTKSFRCGNGRKYVLRDSDFTFHSGEAVALLGRNGAGKSSLLKLLSGVTLPERGTIQRDGSVSWPVAFAAGLHGDMTGAQNIRFVARVFNRDSTDMVEYCRAMSDLGEYLAMPVRTYSAGMRARLAFAMSMAVPFDFYLLDEITSVGDMNFHAKSEDILAARLQRTGGLVVSHSLDSLKRLCTAGIVLENGQLTRHETVASAINHHRTLMAGGTASH